MKNYRKAMNNNTPLTGVSFLGWSSSRWMVALLLTPGGAVFATEAEVVGTVAGWVSGGGPVNEVTAGRNGGP